MKNGELETGFASPNPRDSASACLTEGRGASPPAQTCRPGPSRRSPSRRWPSRRRARESVTRRCVLDGQDAVVDVYKNEVAEDPFEVPLTEKLNILARSCEGMAKATEVKFATASMMSFRERQALRQHGRQRHRADHHRDGRRDRRYGDGRWASGRRARIRRASAATTPPRGFEFTRSLDLAGSRRADGARGRASCSAPTSVRPGTPRSSSAGPSSRCRCTSRADIPSNSTACSAPRRRMPGRAS